MRIVISQMYNTVQYSVVDPGSKTSMLARVWFCSIVYTSPRLYSPNVQHSKIRGGRCWLPRCSRQSHRNTLFFLCGFISNQIVQSLSVQNRRQITVQDRTARTVAEMSSRHVRSTSVDMHVLSRYGTAQYSNQLLDVLLDLASLSRSGAQGFATRSGAKNTVQQLIAAVLALLPPPALSSQFHTRFRPSPLNNGVLGLADQG